MENVIKEIVIAGKEYKTTVEYSPMEAPVVRYKTEEIEVFSKADLVVIKILVGSENVTLRTNAGIDLHSSEGNEYKGVVIEKVPYSELGEEIELIENK